MLNITQILEQLESGDPAAPEQLLPLVYEELRKLAAMKLAQEKPGQTLQATALVHEAYLRLLGDRDGIPWNSRGHFFGAAAEAMRRILVDNARRKRAIKHGGQWERLEIEPDQISTPIRGIDLLVLSDLLDGLAKHDPRKAELVKLRYFCGLSLLEAALALNISESTADADWAYAKSWLKLRMTDE